MAEPRLQWKESGKPDGDLILFLHGFPDSPTTWESQVEYFSKDFLCLAPYNRGVAPDSAHEKPSAHRRDSHVLDLLSLVKEKDPQGTRRVFCVGHDLGAPIAARLARLLGPRLGGLVLINGVSLSQMRRRLTQPKQLLKSWYIYPILVPGVPETLLRFVPKSWLEKARRTAGMPDALAREGTDSPNQLREPLEQYRQYFWEMWDEADPVSERIDRPLLMLFGNHDPFLTLPTMDEARLLGHDAQVRILEGAHWLHLDRAEEVNSFLGSFFEESKKKQ